MTPFLVTLLAGEYVSIKASDLILSTMQVVLLPVIGGLLANTKYPIKCAKASEYTPCISVFFVAMICGTISSTNSGTIIRKVASNHVATVPIRRLMGAIATLHATGFAIGYSFSRIMGMDEKASRTVSIETGMQNSALAAVLAQYFPSPQLSALPGALSATCHSIFGSILAALWRKRGIHKKNDTLRRNQKDV